MFLFLALILIDFSDKVYNILNFLRHIKQGLKSNLRPLANVSVQILELKEWGMECVILNRTLLRQYLTCVFMTSQDY